MRKDICFVCFGQCAGNIGMLFERKGYDVLFINTADADLALVGKAKHVYKIPDVSGCHQDSEKAQVVFAQQYQQIMHRINSFVTKRIVYFISSTGGGTSGMTPLAWDMFLEELKQREDAAWVKYDEACDSGQNPKAPKKQKAGLITVLPSIAESTTLNANSYNYLKQVSEIVDRERCNEQSNAANCFLLDNENSADILKLNQEFVDLFDEILRIPERHKSQRGNVDPADLEEAITTVGITVLSKMAKDVFSISGLVNELRSGKFFAQGEDCCGKYWVSSTIEEVDGLALEKEIGVPITHFKTYNDNTNLFVLSGLNFPAERISLIADRAEEYHSRPQQSNTSIFNRTVTARQLASPEPTQVAAKKTEENSVQNKLAQLRRRRG